MLRRGPFLLLALVVLVAGVVLLHGVGVPAMFTFVYAALVVVLAGVGLVKSRRAP